jgi:hypothetical protein
MAKINERQIDIQVRKIVFELLEIEARSGRAAKLNAIGEKLTDGIVLAMEGKDASMKLFGQKLSRVMLESLDRDPSFEVQALGRGIQACLVDRRIIG